MRKHEGFYIWEDHDIQIIRECRAWFHILDDFEYDLKDKVVLDVGANRGFFTKLAVDSGAKRVIAIEPEKNNVRVLRRNAPTAVCLSGALIGWREETIPLTISKRASHTKSCSVVRSTGGGSIILGHVEAFCFSDILKMYKPNAIKLNCQGAEWAYFQTPLPKCVKFLFGEVHYSGRFLIGKDERMKKLPLKSRTQTERMFQLLRSSGFETFFKRAGKWRSKAAYGSAMWQQDIAFIRR